LREQPNSSILFKTAKEHLYRRVLNYSMKRDRQHGPTIQINRVSKQPPNPTDPQWMGSVMYQIMKGIQDVATDKVQNS
jgi:hypothetical protein